MAERGAHRGTERLGAEHVGAAAQHDSARGAKGVRRADERADVTRVLHAVDDERHAPVADRELIGGPLAGLDDREDPLGRLRVSELLERARRDLLYRDGVALELGTERAAPRRAVELGRDQGAAELEPGAERLLDEPHTLHDGEAATAARLAPLEIAQHRLQITGYEDSLPPAAAGLSKRRRPLRVCQAQGRSVRIALTIAGSDSGGGAGIQADLKTFHQFGVFGTTVLTAVTAQNTRGVQGWQAVPVDLVIRQLDAVAGDLPPLAMKTGMLASGEIVEAVAAGIVRHRLPNYVLDPVMVATSGDRLLHADAARLIAQRLVPLATLVTPNLDEATILLEEEVSNADQMARAAAALVKLGARAALVTGGHLAGDEVVDVFVADGATRRFAHPRLDTASTHGTGCTLSAAVTAGLAHGRPLPEAVADGVAFVQRALAAAPGLGSGHGPLNHFVPAPPRPPTEGL